jgi:hypothetical protein
VPAIPLVGVSTKGQRVGGEDMDAAGRKRILVVANKTDKVARRAEEEHC